MTTATAERFMAVTPCPSCGTWAVHYMRRPRTASPEDRAAYTAALAEWQRIEDNDRTEMKCWGGGTFRVVQRVPPPKPLDDESPYEVIRICRCGQEWGQV